MRNPVVPFVANALHGRRRGGHRQLVEPLGKRGTQKHLRLLRAEADADMAIVGDVRRPRTRGECIDGPRPCPWVGCKYHLALDVKPRSGALVLNVSGASTGDLPDGDSCALDVADDGPQRLERIGELLGLVRERVRQIEQTALRKLMLAARGLWGRR